MIACRTGISLAFVLLALSWVGPASAADLEITKLFTPTPSVKHLASSYTAAKRVPVSHQPVRLALQEELRIPACSGSTCMGPIFLGVGY
jgi:hypothetical protein